MLAAAAECQGARADCRIPRCKSCWHPSPRCQANPKIPNHPKMIISAEETSHFWGIPSTNPYGKWSHSNACQSIIHLRPPQCYHEYSQQSRGSSLLLSDYGKKTAPENTHNFDQSSSSPIQGFLHVVPLWSMMKVVYIPPSFFPYT